MNPFVKKIGIWYSTNDEKEKVFDVLYKLFKNDSNVYKILNSKNESLIEFKNGDSIRFVPLNDFSRGNRFSESFVIVDDNNISEDFTIIKVIQKIVIPKTIIGCGEVYIINNLNNEQDIIYQFTHRYIYRRWISTK